MAIRFTQAARRHRLGRARVMHAMATAQYVLPTVTTQGDFATLYLGRDPRGFWIEVIAVPLADGNLLVIHASPTYEE